jgi:hypothetical protein
MRLVIFPEFTMAENLFRTRTRDGVNYYTIDKNIETNAHIKRQMIFYA